MADPEGSDDADRVVPVADPTEVGLPSRPSAPAAPTVSPSEPTTAPPAAPHSAPYSAPPAESASETPSAAPSAAAAETRFTPSQPHYAPHPSTPHSYPPSDPHAPQYPGQAYPGPLHPGQAPPQQTGWAPPPPPGPRPEHTGRWLAGLTAVIVVVAAVLGSGIWLLVGSLGPSVPAGYRAVDTPYLSYAVPADWTPVTGDAARILGVTFTGGADAPAYTCRGDGYKRGMVTSTLVDTSAEPEEAAADFAGRLGRSFYTDTAGHTPDVALSAPRSVGPGTVVEALVTTPVDDGCLSTEGRVAVLAAPVESGGTALLVVNIDTVGGPGDSPLPDPEIVDLVLGSAG